MQTVAGFPYQEIQFTEDGQPDAGDQATLLTELPAADPTDVFVISHGWRNNVDDARALYRVLLTNMRARLDAGAPAAAGGRRFAVVAALWPSLAFAQDNELPHAVPAGGSAAMGVPQDIPLMLLTENMKALGEALEAEGKPELDAAIRAVGQLGSGPLPDGSDPRQVFVDALRELLPPPTDPGDDASDKLFSSSWDELFDNLKAPLTLVSRQTGGGIASIGAGPLAPPAAAQGGAAGLASMFNGVRAAAWRLLNYASYYVMKARAGRVGIGLNSVLAAVRAQHPDVHIHLIGHSFGARAVTACAAGPNTFAPSSMSLLQGAYSHNALGPGSQPDNIPVGFFRTVITQGRVHGPIIATYTQNDQAVGIAYAIASRLSGDVATDFGGPDDRFGGIGRSGAVRMGVGEVISATLMEGTFAYPVWEPGKVTNLLADGFISNHSDVTNPAVANAVVNACR